MTKEMVLQVRLFDLLAWLLPKSESFPRPHRHTITQRMMDAALDTQEAVFEAQGRHGGHRLAALQRADIALNRLRLYLRLAHHWHWLSAGQYEYASERVAEIGRLLGGWLKQTANGSKR